MSSSSSSSASPAYAATAATVAGAAVGAAAAAAGASDGGGGGGGGAVASAAASAAALLAGLQHDVDVPRAQRLLLVGLAAAGALSLSSKVLRSVARLLPQRRGLAGIMDEGTRRLLTTTTTTTPGAAYAADSDADANDANDANDAKCEDAVHAIVSAMLRMPLRDPGLALNCQPGDDGGAAPGEVSEIAADVSSLLRAESLCAADMRSIIAGGALRYKTLETAPEVLLRATPLLAAPAANGALGTRFTVQYNLYAGSIVALGSSEQREQLYATQGSGALGCFAFTESGTGVLTGAACETTATYDAETEEFVIHSPNGSSVKNWISQGMYAEYAVILADLITPDDVHHGPHLFWQRIATRQEDTWARVVDHSDSDSANAAPVATGSKQQQHFGALTHLEGVEVESLPLKLALRSLDNARIRFSSFRVPRSALLSRFSEVDAAGKYTAKLPSGLRMVDLLVGRLLTGRICLSEYSLAFSMALARRAWKYCEQRELWRGRKDQGPSMASKPLVAGNFADYARCNAIVAHFIAVTRERVAACIKKDVFPHPVVEAACIAKFVGTSFAVDMVSAVRKTLGSQAMMDEMGLGHESFVCNATCAAEGDNTIMELKVLQDVVRRRTSLFPVGLMACATDKNMFALSRAYAGRLGKAMVLGHRALSEGQLLKDAAWSRAHLLIVKEWKQSGGPNEWLDSYFAVIGRIPTPVQH